MLKAKPGTQSAPRDSLEVYECTLPRSTAPRPLRILYAANCTGEYFGEGPTCRCEASMRFFNVHLSATDSSNPHPPKWFAFLDDDFYLRPIAVMKMLHMFDNTVPPLSSPAALVSSREYEGFRFSTVTALENNGNACCSAKDARLCKYPEVFGFGYAQPVFMNRRALAMMDNALQANGLTRYQALYGGTHDIILGLLLWVYQVPVYSYSASYYGMRELNVTDLRSYKFKDNTLIFHKIQNRQRKPRPFMPRGDRVISHYDMARKLNDTYGFSASSVSTNAAASTAAAGKGKKGLLADVQPVLDLEDVRRQEKCGEKAFGSLVKKRGEKSVLLTTFADAARAMTKHFTLFLPRHCKVQTQIQL